MPSLLVAAQTNFKFQEKDGVPNCTTPFVHGNTLWNITIDRVGKSKHNKTLLKYKESCLSFDSLYLNEVLLCFDLPTLSIVIL